MTRRTFIERTLRQIYNGQPSDDSNITDNLVNIWVTDGLAIAARKNYIDNYTIEGINFVNNGFYTTFSDLTITKDSAGVYKFELPEIPVGLGYSMGVSTIQFVDGMGVISRTGIPLSENQVTYFGNMRPIPNKLQYYTEGKFCYVLSTLILTPYTAKVRMISGGNSTDLDSELNVPPDYLNTIQDYIKQQLLLEKAQPIDVNNDGLEDK